MKAKIVTVITILLLVILNLSIWKYVNNPLQMQSWNRTMMGVAYNPMRKDHDPEKHTIPTDAEIEADLAMLSDKVFAVRTYTSLEGQDRVPAFASKYDLNVTVGAWLDKDLAKNRAEIESLIKISRTENRNIVRTIVGNEVLERKDLPVEQLIQYIREVKKRTWRPVSTSETWSNWLEHPELADEVDYIAVHIFPFWEGLSVDEAVNFVFDRYYAMQKAFPNKPIVITEVGWPSDGQTFKRATPSLANQAKFLRQFLNRATS